MRRLCYCRDHPCLLLSEESCSIHMMRELGNSRVCDKSWVGIEVARQERCTDAVFATYKIEVESFV